MKITLIREERESGKEAVSTQETDMLMEKLKTENKTGYITELRSIIPHLKGTNARYEHIDRLPRLYPAVEMTRTKAGEHRIKTYNGLVLLEVNNLAGVAEAELVKQQAALLPQTFAAFCGSSGRSAKIWVRFTLPDGGLPKNEDDIALFHAHAYRLAVKCYQPLLPFPITLQAPSLLQSCRMTVDEQPYYSPTAVAFCLEQPCALPSEDNLPPTETAGKQSVAENDSRLRSGGHMQPALRGRPRPCLPRFGQLATGRRPAPAAVPPCRTLLQSRHS